MSMPQQSQTTSPRLARKVILAGTGPAGGAGIDKVTFVTFRDMKRAERGEVPLGDTRTAVSCRV